MRITKLLVVAAGVWAPAVSPAWANHSGDVNCDDFTYQEEAQAHFNAHPGDPDRLDQGGVPGVPCEDLPRRGTATPPPVVTPTTVGSSATVTRGAGPASAPAPTRAPAPVAGRKPLARTGSENGELAAVASGLVAAGALLLAASRRRLSD